jgi:hypothetical protein
MRQGRHRGDSASYGYYQLLGGGDSGTAAHAYSFLLSQRGESSTLSLLRFTVSRRLRVRPALVFALGRFSSDWDEGNPTAGMGGDPAVRLRDPTSQREDRNLCVYQI